MDEIIKLNQMAAKFPDTEQLIKESIKEAFLEVEKTYIEAARVAYGMGTINATKVSGELPELVLALWSASYMTTSYIAATLEILSASS